MQSKRLAILLVVLLTYFPVMAQETAFSVDDLVQQGILEGDGNGDLRLDSPVTRAEMTKMLGKALKLEKMDTVSFSDVPAGHWAYADIAKGVSRGFINGYEDGTLRPDNPVLIEEAVKMTVYGFTGKILSYPAGYVSEALSAGLLEQVSAVTGETALRRDIATLLINAFSIYQASCEPADSSNLPVPLPSSAVKEGAGGGGSASSLGFMPSEDAYLPEDFNTEEYSGEEENIFKLARTSPLSTFSIDVDTASYSNVRRFLSRGTLPPVGSVRTEELINYFDYAYPQPQDNQPFSISTEVAECPWNTSHKLAMIGLKGRELTQRQPSNLVLLLDTSGSMYSENKLPLVQKAMKLLADTLDENDRVSIVTYAGSSSVALAGAKGFEKEKIAAALDGLSAGGFTAGGAGIELAYQTAEENRVEGNNRVILCTDGDFNIGVTSTAELEKLITEKKQSGIFLSVLGFGMGNYKDNRMETLADKGDGNYAYIDNLREANKVLVQDMTKTLFTIAKDVKIQVEFNPRFVKEYRLVGYENRKLENEDFDNDRKDAGELGAGHTVTAFYELVMSDGESQDASLKYQESVDLDSGELMEVRLRYKEPAEEESKLVTKAVAADSFSASPSEDFRFAAAVAQYGMLLNNSDFSGTASFDDIVQTAKETKGADPFGIRSEFIQLAALAGLLFENQ